MLTIISPTASDTGLYTLTATTASMQESVNVTLIVTGMS